MVNNTLKAVEMPLKDLKEYANNPRKITQNAVDYVAKAIEKKHMVSCSQSLSIWKGLSFAGMSATMPQRNSGLRTCRV